MKKALLFSSLLALGAAASFATPVSCTGLQITAASIATANQISCEIGDKIFSGFSLTGASTGLVTINGGGTLYTLQYDNQTSPLTTGFTLGFTVAVDTLLQPLNYITQVQDQMFTQNQGGGNAIPNASTAVVTHSPGGVINLNANPISQNQGGTANMFTQSEGISFAYDTHGTGQLSAVNFSISQSTVPEPVSMSLTGLGLLGLGFFGRRRLKA